MTKECWSLNNSSNSLSSFFEGRETIICSSMEEKKGGFTHYEQ